MSTTIWEKVDTLWCDHMQQPAELLEERVYPGEPMPDVGQPHQVKARKCSLAVQCNLAEYACRWAYTNPSLDPFDR
jgi:hypothetical protein